jgi:signal transduction histidine kinase
MDLPTRLFPKIKFMENTLNYNPRIRGAIKQFQILDESYKNLYDNTIVALFVTDTNTLKVVKVNKIGVALFGYKTKKELYEGFTAEAHFENAVAQDAAGNTGFLQHDINTKIQAMKRLDGSPFWARIFTKLSADQNLAYTVLIDSTEQVRLEHENKRYIKILEDIKVDSYKTAHDMKSPLANIIGIVGLAIDETSADDGLRDYLMVIKSEAEKLDKNVRQIIVNTAIKKEVYEFHSIDFIKTIEDVKHSISFIDGFAEVTFYEDITSDVPYACDKLVITSLFQNLIDNAIKYRNKKETSSFIKISVATSMDNATIVIEDNGIGIAPEKQEDIFKLFYRATDEIEGNGLGLFTLKYNIEKLGGTIAFDSKENEGTKFTIVLPNYCEIGVCDC